jgi:hypothetical protein
MSLPADIDTAVDDRDPLHRMSQLVDAGSLAPPEIRDNSSVKVRTGTESPAGARSSSTP